MPMSKSNAICKWKKSGLIYDNYDELYETYIKTMECEHCKTEFTEKNLRCMDHDHTTGLFRKIVCNRCNVKDSYIRFPNGYSRQAYYQEYCQANKQKIKEHKKEYYQANKEKISEYRQEYRQKNKEHMQEYYQKNKEQRKEQIKEYQRANKERISAYKNQKIECDCGSIVCRAYIAKHKRTKKHSDYKLNNLV